MKRNFKKMKSYIDGYIINQHNCLVTKETRERERGIQNLVLDMKVKCSLRPSYKPSTTTNLFTYKNNLVWPKMTSLEIKF